MRTDELKEKYYKWLTFKIGHPGGYKKLLRLLHSIDFTYKIDMDANRYEDGIELRYTFMSGMGIEYREGASILDVTPCSVLEMMAALAVRIEHDIMAEPDGEDRTWFWFESMLQNSGLAYENDKCFNEEDAKRTVKIMLEREYQYDGSGGGLFTLNDPPNDLRRTEIWYQAMWWLTDYI